MRKTEKNIFFDTDRSSVLIGSFKEERILLPDLKVVAKACKEGIRNNCVMLERVDLAAVICP